MEAPLTEPVQEPAPVEEASLSIPSQEVPKIHTEEKPVEIAVPATKPSAKKRPEKQPSEKKLPAEKSVSLPAKPKATEIKKPEPEVSLETPLVSEKQSLPEPTPPQFSELTKDVQSKLQTLGFYQGEPNGLLDTNTASAINSFEEVFGLEVSGKITGALLSELDNARVTQTPVAERPAAEPEAVLEASLTPAPLKIEAPIEPEPKPDLIVEAKKTSSAAATYPNIAIRRGHDKNTTVVVVYDVDANGTVTNVTTKDVIGAGRFKRVFEKSAIKAAQKVKFAPKTVNGEAVSSQNLETKFTFNIE